MPEGGKPPAVLLGGGLGALSVARTLGRNGVTVYVLSDAERDDQAASSRFVTSFVPVQDGECVEKRWLTWLRSAPGGCVLFPCSDEGLEFVARHRAELEMLGLRPIPARDQAVLHMLDKATTYRLAAAAGLAVPRTAEVSTLSELRSAATQFDYPCALKPRVGHRYRQHFTGKVVVASCPAELEQAFLDTSDAGVDTIVTEIVQGKDEYCSYYTYIGDDGQPLASYTKRKLRQWPLGFGMGTAHLSAWQPEVAALGQRFAEHVGLRGLVNLEFKQSSKDNSLTLIECNARITASNELVRRSGPDLARMAYADALGERVARDATVRDGMQQWHVLSDTRAFLGLRREGELTLQQWLQSLRGMQRYVPPFSLDDPRPAMRYVSTVVGGAVTSRATKALRRTRAGQALRPRDAGMALQPSDAGEASRTAEGNRTSILRGQGGGPSRDGVSAMTRLLGLASVLPAQHTAARIDLVRSAGLVRLLRHSRWGRSFPGEALDREVYTQLWKKAALNSGAESYDLGNGFIEVRRGRSRTVVHRQEVMLDDAVSLRLSMHKSLLQGWLLAAGIQVPEHVVLPVAAWRDGRSFLERTRPCFVKPAAGTGGGQGVTGGVATLDQLGRAAVHAARFGGEFILEQQIVGDEYRLLLLDGEPIDCLQRRPPALLGDGRSTISALISKENSRRAVLRGAVGLFPIRVDLDLLLTLERAGMSLASVPAAGRRFAVKSTANESGAGDSHSAIAPVEVLTIAVAAVQMSGLRLASVEVVAGQAEDGSIRATVLEVNGNPGLHYHYQTDDATKVDVAAVILNRLLETASGTGGPKREDLQLRRDCSSGRLPVGGMGSHP